MQKLREVQNRDPAEYGKHMGFADPPVLDVFDADHDGSLRDA